MERIGICRPDVGPVEAKAVMEVMKSGQIAEGPMVEEFEKRFARFIGTRYAVACSSGTSALHLAYIAAGFNKTNDVMTSPLTFNATTNMLKARESYIDYIDIKDDFNMDEDLVINSEKNQRIVPVHLFGKPCNMWELSRKFKRLHIVEDCAQALGAEVDGNKVGSFGLVGCFSFYPSKMITTGEGGMCTTNSTLVADKIRDLKLHSLKSKDIGYNYRMTDIEAAIGIIQMNKLKDYIRMRRELAKLYNDSFEGLIQNLPCGEGHVYNNYSFCLPDRDRFIYEMGKRNIDCRVYYPTPLEKLPNVSDVCKKIVSIPLRPNLTPEEVNHIINSTREILKK